MNKLPALIAKKVRLGLMIDLLNELASSSPSDQSQVKIDLVAELERLRVEMTEMERKIESEQMHAGKTMRG